MPVLNINVGLLGHVDSGKTSLAKCLSTVGSTACFDKCPQSQERGITIDLGFSSYRTDQIPEQLKHTDYDCIQYTLVDCPGHASLIRTVIGGVHIIDVMILVIDILKGFQTQTAECLIIGELLNKEMVVVLNKVDLLPQEKKHSAIEKMTRKVKAILSNTVFKDSPIICVSTIHHEGLDELKALLLNMTVEPKRLSETKPMLFAVDHCFFIKGKGTIMTGTIVRGTIKVNDDVEVLGTRKKVKSMERFREVVTVGRAGDRLGVCLTQFDAKLLERGVACTPGTLDMMHAAIVILHPIKYYKSAINNTTKYHVTIGYETTLCSLTMFTLAPLERRGDASTSKDKSEEVEEPIEEEFSLDKEYLYKEVLDPEEFPTAGNSVMALLQPDRVIPVWDECMMIGSRLDTDLNSHSCRLVFSGKIVHPFKDCMYRSTDLPSLRIYKNKEKQGTVARIVSQNEIIASNIFKKETDMNLFLNLKVELSTGEHGFIESTFGTTGKVKIRIPDGLKPETMERFKSTDSKAKQKQGSVLVFLKFKKYIYDKGKGIHQS